MISTFLNYILARTIKAIIMNVENIKSIFIDYLINKNTNYALLLNGNWGSGKSFFWKNSLLEIAKENGYDYIYISLNGVNKIETLEHLLFLKLLPIIGKKENGILKNSTTLLTNVLNKVSSHYLKTSISDIFKGVSVDGFNFSKYIICFDDLERSQIPLKEALGFINNYVEHKNLKTIILADESEINKSQNDKIYNNIKEKLIGRVLNFKLDINQTLPDLFKKYKASNLNYYNFLIHYQEYLNEILIEYNQQNLRTISFYLDTLEKIYPNISNENEKFIKEIILFSIIVTIEFKTGKISSNDFDNFEEFAGYNRFTILTESIILNSQKKENSDRVKTKKEEFKETYLTKRFAEYAVYPSIYSFILSGYLNVEDLKNQLINKNKFEFGTPESVAYSKLLNYNFRQLSDSEFEQLLTEVKNYAEKGCYAIYDYSQIANFYYFFATKNLTNLSNEEIKKFILKGLTESSKKKEIDENTFENLFHFEAENEQVEEIRDTIKGFHEEIKKEKDAEKSNELIEYIKDNNDKSIKDFFTKFNLSTDLFLYIDVESFFKEIINTQNSTIETLNRLIASRYKSINIGEFLYEDINVLEQLKGKLEQYTEEEKTIKPLRQFILNNLLEKLALACEHLEKTKKVQ